MKFTRIFLFLFIFSIFSCSKKYSVLDVPEYKFICDFSEKIKKDFDLTLYCYGVNIGSKPKNVKFGISNFRISYYVSKKKGDAVTLEESRNLIIFVVEKLLSEINYSDVIRDRLDVFPFTSNSIDLMIYFKDENKIDLGNGIATVSLYNEKIKYEKYDISEYRKTYPCIGKHHVIHQESYEDALQIVKGNNPLTQIEDGKI
jgi:hypothetical protein